MTRQKRILTVLAVTGLSIGLTASCVATANAAVTEYRYPVSSGSFERGYWRGSYNVQIDSSSVSLYSNSGWTHCKAVQDTVYVAAQESSRGVYCSVSVKGVGTLTVGDYVEFGTK